MNKQRDSKNKPVFSIKNFMNKYLAFVGMFVGAGFISGSIVHLGEGVNPWDVSVLIVGVLFFSISTCVQEFVFNKKDYKQAGVISFIMYSIVLSIGVGMASGGIQHYVDTPFYSAYLIPIGFALGIIAFFLKEQGKLSLVGWCKFLGLTGVLTIFAVWGLGTLANHIPETLLQGQGHSHGHRSTESNDVSVETTAVIDVEDEDHDHSSHEH